MTMEVEASRVQALGGWVVGTRFAGKLEQERGRRRAQRLETRVERFEES